MYYCLVFKKTDMTNTFKINEIFQMRFIGDSNLRPEFKCVKRTAKTASFKRVDTQNSEIITRRIKVDFSGNEFIVDGNFSMAPSINAKNRV